MRVSDCRFAVPNPWLLALAGILWTAVGAMLCRTACVWLIRSNTTHIVAFIAVGAVAALAAYRFAFSRLAQRNMERIRRLPERACVLAFQAGRTYLLIAFMIGLGITLRHSAVPKCWLAEVYLTIGGALLLGSLGYYVRLWTLFSAPSDGEAE